MDTTAFAAPHSPTARLPVYLALATMVLGLASFFLGFAPYAEGEGESINFFEFGHGGLTCITLLLAAALLSGFGLLPQQPRSEAVEAALSVTAFVALLMLLIDLPDDTSAGAGLIVVLILAFIQAAITALRLVLAAGVIRVVNPGRPDATGPGFSESPPGSTP